MEDKDKFAFAIQHEAYLRSVCKWIMDVGATKHMTLYRVGFNTYEVISPHYEFLIDGWVAKAIGMGFIVDSIES